MSGTVAVEIWSRCNNARDNARVLFSAQISESIPERDRVRFAVEVAAKGGADLTGASLVGLNLAGANLIAGNFRDADLSSTDLAGAYLDSANLSGAVMRSTSLNGASLLGASFASASMESVSLDGASVFGANFAGARWQQRITLKRAPMTVSGLDYQVIILDDHMQIGCQLHPISAWGEFDYRRIAEMDGKRAVAFWRRHGVALIAMARSDGRGEGAGT